VGIIEDGQLSIRCVVADVFPDVLHQLCHFHARREAAKLICEAENPAKKALKQRLHGVCLLEGRLADRRVPKAEVV
jgi:hypothetical protein